MTTTKTPKRFAICPKCKKEMEVRDGHFASKTIENHMKKEHK